MHHVSTSEPLLYQDDYATRQHEHSSADTGLASSETRPAEDTFGIASVDTGQPTGYIPFNGFAQDMLATWLGPSNNEDWSPAAAASVSAAGQQTSPNAEMDIFSTSPDTVHARAFTATPIVERGVDLFFSQLYPTFPVVDETSLRSLLGDTRELSRGETTLLWAICAMALINIDHWPTLDADARAKACEKYIRRCLDARNDSDFIENAGFYDVLTSLFLSVAYFDLKCRKASWYYLREAITLATAAGLPNAGNSASLDFSQRLRYQRTYALLYISERGACTLNNFPVSMIVPPGLPVDPLPGEDPSLIMGLSSLYHLFSLLDSNFVRLWNDTNLSAATSHGHAELSTLQDHLREPLDLRHVNDVQRANVLVTQQWLRLIFWQASLKMSLISSSASDSAFTYHYPIEIATSLCDVVKSLPPVAIQAHGLGIFEKQFEIAYSLLDALTLSGHLKTARHRETLRYLLLSLSASPNSRQIYVRPLERKLDQSENGSSGDHKYLRLAGVQLLNEDGSSRQNSRRPSVWQTSDESRQCQADTDNGHHGTSHAHNTVD